MEHKEVLVNVELVAPVYSEEVPILLMDWAQPEGILKVNFCYQCS